MQKVVFVCVHQNGVGLGFSGEQACVVSSSADIIAYLLDTREPLLELTLSAPSHFCVLIQASLAVGGYMQDGVQVPRERENCAPSETLNDQQQFLKCSVTQSVPENVETFVYCK